MSDTLLRNPVGDTSLSLIRRVRREDPEAWERLATLYGPVVFGWCRFQYGLDEQTAKDIGQEVFLAVHVGICDFQRDREGDTFRGWLRTITLNKVRDFARRHTNAERGQGGDDHLRRLRNVCAPAESPDSLAAEAAEIYGRALEFVRAEFKETTWRAFWRTAVDGQTSTGVAEELNMKPSAVRQARARVRARLRRELEGLVALDDGAPLPE